MLAGVDTQFPVTRWDLLLHQAEITINLLRTSQIDPAKSAWELMCGPFNYNATPMGPPGCRIIIHAKGTTRQTWDFKGIEGFYIGLAMNHYCCYTLLRNNTQAMVVSDTVIFQHHTLNLPVLTAEDCIIYCLRALTTAIRANRSPTRMDEQLLAIESLRAIFSNIQHPPAVQQRTTPPSAPAPAPRMLTPASTPRVSALPQKLPRVLSNPPPTTTAPPMLAPRLQPSADTRLIALRTRSHGVALSANLPKTTPRAEPQLPAETNPGTPKVDKYISTQLPAEQQLPAVSQLPAETNPGTPKVDKYISNPKMYK